MMDKLKQAFDRLRATSNAAAAAIAEVNALCGNLVDDASANIVTVYLPTSGWGQGAENLNWAEAWRYILDPIAECARWADVERGVYAEWIETIGTPLCRGTTRAGTPCRNFVGRGQQPIEEWMQHHRIDFCAAHKPPPDATGNL